MDDDLSRGFMVHRHTEIDGSSWFGGAQTWIHPHVINPLQSNVGPTRGSFILSIIINPLGVPGRADAIPGPAPLPFTHPPHTTTTTTTTTNPSTTPLFHHFHQHGQISEQTHPRATLRPPEAHLLSASPSSSSVQPVLILSSPQSTSENFNNG